jgi:drug/metabolite transporter (DMT)-like permease
VYALPALWILSRMEDGRFGPRTPRTRAVAWIAGIFFAADLAFWHRAIQAVGAGLATVLGNLQVVVVAVVARIFLGERVDKRLVLAIPLALIGVLLISGVLEEGAYGDDPALGVLFGVLTSLAYTGFLLLLRHGAADLRRVAGPLFDATLVGAVVAAAIGAASQELSAQPAWPAHGWLIVLALTSQVVGWLLISVSLPRLPAALTSLLLLVQPAGSVGLAIVLLDESPSALQLGGVGLVLAGVFIAARARHPVPATVPTPEF